MILPGGIPSSIINIPKTSDGSALSYFYMLFFFFSKCHPASQRWNVVFSLAFVLTWRVNFSLSVGGVGVLGASLGKEGGAGGGGGVTLKWSCLSHSAVGG